MASGAHPCTEQLRPSHCCLLESLLRVLQAGWKAAFTGDRELREHSYLIPLPLGVLPGNSVGVQIKCGAEARACWSLSVRICLSPLPTQPPGQDANLPGSRDPAHPTGEPGGSGQDPHARENSKHSTCLQDCSRVNQQSAWCHFKT